MIDTTFARLATALLVVALPASAVATEPSLANRFHPLDEFKTPGLEAELSGIYPHPSNADLYYVLANAEPPYRYGQKPVLPERYRGDLLLVDRAGAIVRALDLGNEHFGGLALVDGVFYAALTNAAEVLRLDPQTGRILSRFPTSAAIGGLGYDPDRKLLIAQIYVGFPRLELIDPKTGAVVETLPSDESTMSVIKVGSDWLATWASGWEPGSHSELRRLDPKTGRTLDRIRLPLVHSVLAPARDGRGGGAFLSLVTVDSVSGETLVRRYAYAPASAPAP
jgi:hypothetical protein